MQRLRRFARYWDLVGNSGNFRSSVSMIWAEESPFEGFLRFSDWVYQRVNRTDSISLNSLAELIFSFLTDLKQMEPAIAAQAVIADFHRAGRKELPESLRQYTVQRGGEEAMHFAKLPKRQARHA
jgi:hypothetical protein